MVEVTNLVSVLTPVHGPSIPYLADAYESLRSQRLPDGWDWQWVVQEDGLSGAVAAALPDDPRISSGSGRPAGPAVARNMALARAEGSLVRVLDADDQLAEGALAREISVLTQHEDIGWTTASVLDLLPDGSTVSWEHSDPPEGRLTRTHVLSYFQANRYRLPVHPATLCIRRDLVLALGGWMAVPGGEDTGLLLAASVMAGGYFISAPGLLYRKHPHQITAQTSWSGTNEWTARMQLIESRALALRALWSDTKAA